MVISQLLSAEIEKWDVEGMDLLVDALIDHSRTQVENGAASDIPAPILDKLGKPGDPIPEWLHDGVFPNLWREDE